jgi:flagellar hook-length control protein FliK
MAAEASEAGDASEAVGAREDAVDEGKTAADAASLGATNIAGVPVEPDPDSLSKGDPDGAKAASTHDADTPGPCGNGLSPAAPAFAAPPSVPVPQTGVAGRATDLAASAAKNVGATLPATAQGRPVEAGTGPAPEAGAQGDAELNPARAPHKAPFEPAPAGSDQAGIADRIDLSPAANQDGARPPPGPLQGPDPGAAAPKAAAAVPAPPAHLPIVHQVPIGAVPVEIGLKSLAGTNRFEIRLDPEELGRIDVRLDIDESGGVKAHLVVDRVETLALLQRDAKTLERAFEQAGLKPSEGGVDLSLRDPSSDGRQNGESREERPRPGPGAREDAAAGARADAPALRPVYRAWRGSAGIDLRI